MLEKHKYLGKTKEEIIDQIKKELAVDEKEVIIIESSKKEGLFNKKTEYEVILKKDINNYLKEEIKQITTNMGIEVNIETKNRDENVVFTLIGNNNSILIGKSGRTIDALQTIIKSNLYNEIHSPYNFVIDVSDYKLKNQSRLEKLAKYTAKDVARMKIEIKLDPMNSYERRIIHNILNDSKDVTTESEGEEPNRYIVIKPKN